MMKDMTRGPLLPLIIKFTLPLVAASMLQLTYNAVDSIIVGKFVSADALAAVGTSNPIMTLIVMCVQGATLGSGILIGNYYGARDFKKLQRQISTAMLTGSFFSLAVAGLIFILSGQILTWLQVDPEIFSLARSYLRIVGAGLIFNYAYNFLANTLRALGDSRTPLLFLAVSAGMNIGGDLFFVMILHMGVTGCAVSTVICEALSSVFCLLYITKKVPVLNMGRRWFVFDWSMLKRTLQFGFVSALQQSTVQLGIVGVQGLVNSLGTAATAGFAAANRIDDFALIPPRNIANAMTAVIAQNVGAKERKRVVKSFRIGLALALTFGVGIGIMLLLFANPMMTLFTNESSVVKEGEIYLHLIALMYVLPAFTNALQGYFRGIGDLKITLISSLINMGVRFASCFYFVARRGMGIEAVPWACMAGWVTMIVFELPYLIRFRRKQLI